MQDWIRMYNHAYTSNHLATHTHTHTHTHTQTHTLVFSPASDNIRHVCPTSLQFRCLLDVGRGEYKSFEVVGPIPKSCPPIMS